MAKTRAKVGNHEEMIALLRSLPIDRRANALISLFRLAAAEFAVMVLEYTKPQKKRLKKVGVERVRP
jgi:hypothetical protein